MFVPYLAGYTFSWTTAFKRRDFDVKDPAMRATITHTTAAEHPLLHEILRPPGPTDAPIFGDVSLDRISHFVRSFVRDAPDSFDVRTYGARTGADTEGAELGLPHALHDVLFWWKRETKSGVMRNYYTGQNILKMFLFSRARLTVVMTRFQPGAHAVRLTADPPDWVKAIVSSEPLPPPNVLLLDEAWRFVPTTFTSRKRARLATPPATAASTDPHGPLTGVCISCSRRIGRLDKATLCEVAPCDVMICPACHTYDTTFYCNLHRHTPPPK